MLHTYTFILWLTELVLVLHNNLCRPVQLPINCIHARVSYYASVLTTNQVTSAYDK